LKPRLLLPFPSLVGLLLSLAPSGATLTYVRGELNPRVFVAEDDGSGAVKVGKGRTPRVSPDGQSVAYLREGTKNAQELKLTPAAGPTRTLLVGWRESSTFAWSPDSKTIAALRGPEIGKRHLVLIDVASGKQNFVASGYFSGVSFSPDSTEIVYARSGSEDFPPRGDVFRFPVPIPGVVNVRAPEPVRLTRDHRSSDPLWGPTGQIVFVKTVEARKRKYGPKNELFLMNPQGKQVKRLTTTKVPPLLQGLFPTDWSADGTRLLAEFEGQDTSYAVTVNPKTGAQSPVAEAGENGFVGAALSADGKQVLGFTGGFDPSGDHKVATVPYGGGKLQVLAKNAFEPDWSR
jgi:Tol biopolymer transport system component